MSGTDEILSRLYADGFTFEDIIIAIEQRLTTAEQREEGRKLREFQQEMLRKNIAALLGEFNVGECLSKGRIHRGSHLFRADCVEWRVP